MQEMYHQASCACHPSCSDGSSTGLLALCLQTNSGNRNTQWLSVLCQHCWSQSPHLSTSRIYCHFSVFLALLNLDFGIETCFYNGMDAYGKTWLQFVIPVYIFGY